VNWVSTEIVESESSRNRANTIKHFITLASKLRMLNNFDGLKGVLCGLQASGVRRLRRTWELVPAKAKSQFEDLEALMQEDKSYKAYRQNLHTLNPPCIPFIGIYLTDLTFIETGNPDFLEPGHLINFYKRHLIAQVIHEVKQYQQTPYVLSRSVGVEEWIRSRPVKDAQQVYDRSLKVEPRR
jgi:son of sevenless-like protein